MFRTGVESVSGKIKFPQHLVFFSLGSFALPLSARSAFKIEKKANLPAGRCTYTDSCAQNKRCHCHDQIRCWMLMCTSPNRRHRHLLAYRHARAGETWNAMISFVFLSFFLWSGQSSEICSTHELSSFLKYEILSPHRLHPIFESLASVTEYINGRIPSLYKLPDFTKFTIDSLRCDKRKREREKTQERKSKILSSWIWVVLRHRDISRFAHIRTCTWDLPVCLWHESRTIACVCSCINRVASTTHNRLASP